MRLLIIGTGSFAIEVEGLARLKGLATVISQFTSAIIAPVFFKETRVHTKYILEAFIGKGIR